MRIIRLLEITFILMCFCGCTNDEMTPHDLNVSNIKINDCPPGSRKNVFECIGNGGVYKCSVTTIYIRKQQNIANIKAYYLGHELFVRISLDKDMFPALLDRMTKVEFELEDLPQGIYDIDLMIDNGHIPLTPSTWKFD